MTEKEEKKLMTKTQLKEQRLKPAPTQVPVKQYWSNRAKAWFDLYDPTEAVPMREYRPPSEKQAAALERGRYLATTIECPGCKERFEKWDITRQGMCRPCEIAEDKAAAVWKATTWIEADPLFLDVETTGLDHDAEVIEVAILDKHGATLLDTLVRPVGQIEPGAIGVHGITPEMVASAPLFADIASQIAALIEGRMVIAHNSSFDERLIYRGFMKTGAGLEDLPKSKWRCTMHLLTDINDGRWPTLGLAMELAGASFEGIEDAHRAKADAEGCRRIVMALTGLQEPLAQE